MAFLDFIFGNGNQLKYERNKVILAGPADDIARLKKLDKAIGKLTAAYNGVARAPDDVTRKIDALVAEARPSFPRVVAKKPYEENMLESLSGRFRGAEPVTAVPIDKLEYVITYPGSYGKPIEQRLAQFFVRR
jgi:hypothetical protein